MYTCTNIDCDVRGYTSPCVVVVVAALPVVSLALQMD